MLVFYRAVDRGLGLDLCQLCQFDHAQRFCVCRAMLHSFGLMSREMSKQINCTVHIQNGYYSVCPGHSGVQR